jgi:hypothetical protein
MSSIISFPQTRMITALHIENVTEGALDAFLRNTGADFWLSNIPDTGLCRVNNGVVTNFYPGHYLVKVGQAIEGSFTPEEFAAKYQAN